MADESWHSLSACLPGHLLSRALFCPGLSCWNWERPSGTRAGGRGFVCSSWHTILHCQQNAKPTFQCLLQLQFFILVPEVFQFCRQTWWKRLNILTQGWQNVLSCVPCVCSEEWQQNIPSISQEVSSSGQCHFVKEAKINALNACKSCK